MHPPMVKEDPQQVQILIHQIEDFDLGRAVVVEAYPYLCSDGGRSTQSHVLRCISSCTGLRWISLSLVQF